MGKEEEKREKEYQVLKKGVPAWVLYKDEKEEEKKINE